MNHLQFEDLDKYLLDQKSKIIHQIWFGIIPNKKSAAKAFKSLKKCRDSWMIKNPKWVYICWNLDKCYNLVKNYYPQHLETFKKYNYHIQRCDVARYFILHRYGGLYADMDYYCNKSWNEVILKYPKDIYLVETPNNIYKIYDNVHISNSLMYCSKPNHIFWNKLFIDLEINKKVPIYYSRHMTIMFTTGPGVLNRTFNKYITRFKLNYYPYKLFHPYGLLNKGVIKLNDLNSNLFAINLGKGSWEKSDSLFLFFLYKDISIIIFIILIITIPNLFLYFFSKKKRIQK